LSKERRKRELLRITKENQQILRRIQNAQPAYSHMKWEEEARKNDNILENISEFKTRHGKKQKENYGLEDDSIFFHAPADCAEQNPSTRLFLAIEVSNLQV